jgi:hypothetical protein
MEAQYDPEHRQSGGLDGSMIERLTRKVSEQSRAYRLLRTAVMKLPRESKAKLFHILKELEHGETQADADP